jgi:hypothetical protein
MHRAAAVGVEMRASLDPMADNADELAADQRTSLLRHGIVVLDEQLDADEPCVTVAAPRTVAADALVCEAFGQRVSVEVAGELPRELWPRPCVGYMEREPGRLQLRYVLRGDQHVDDIVVAEDDDAVVVFATVCMSLAGSSGEACEVPFHVYLDRPLGDRTVIDGVSDKPVPYSNVYERLRSEADSRKRAW